MMRKYAFTIGLLVAISFAAQQAYCACDTHSAAKIQKSDGYIKVCSGGTLEINSGATFSAVTGSYSGAVDIAGQLTQGTAGSKSTVTTTGVATFKTSVTAPTITATGALAGATVNTGQGANEVYAMDQDIQTTNKVSFDSMTITNTGASSLDIGGGLNAGTGNVGIIDATGKIPALTSAYFTSLDGSNLTNVVGVGSVLASSDVWIGDSSGNAAAHSITGDITLSAGGVVAVVSLPAISGAALTALTPENMSAGSLPENVEVSSTSLDGNIPDSKLATISTAGKVADAALSANVLLANSSPTVSGEYTFNNSIIGSITGNSATATDIAGGVIGQVLYQATSGDTAFVAVPSDTSVLVSSAGATVPYYLAYSTTNAASTIVERDGSGNFAAGTITASVTGAASLNVLKSGDTMTGKLALQSKSLSELLGISPAVGDMYVCSDCTPAYSVAIGTGTGAGNFGIFSPGTLQ